MAPDASGPLPCVVCYIPYHKDDNVGAFLYFAHKYFVAHGYAALLVDFRGLGNSNGVARGALDSGEGEDLTDVVDWVGRQDWCDGNVGCWGHSYGAITALRAGAVGSRYLKAVVAIMGSADLYEDFFYPGGCQNCLSAYGAWGPLMVALQLMPPMHQDAGGRWYSVWRDRLQNATPYMLEWQDHRSYDEYWSGRAIDVEKSAVPTFIIGGWRDIFPEGMVRVYEGLIAPKRLLMGPWPHVLPDVAPTAPVDYLIEVVAWWDAWLRPGSPATNRSPHQDDATVYVQGRGDWRRWPTWPPKDSRCVEVFLEPAGALRRRPSADLNQIPYAGDPTVGTVAGLWDPVSLGAVGLGQPDDQRADEARSLNFTGGVLEEALDIVGSAEARLFVRLEAGGDDFDLVVKLSDVAPDGHSTLITTGWLKASHRSSHSSPQPVPRGQVEEYSVALWATAYSVARGHRLRVSLATADFPRIWPSRQTPTLCLFVGGSMQSSVRMPTVESGAGELVQVPVPDPSLSRAPLAVKYEPAVAVHREQAENQVRVTRREVSVLDIPGGDGRIELDHATSAVVKASRPDGAKVEARTQAEAEMPDGARVVVDTATLTTAHGMVVNGTVMVDGILVFERQWSR